ncbi:hypothetical protein ACIBSR_13610 [Streptomyces sp. NPDC049936]
MPAAGDYEQNTAYAQSKAANVRFAVELDRLWPSEGVRGCHP